MKVISNLTVGLALATALLTITLSAGSPARADTAAAEGTFKMKCGACHGADAKGKTALKTRDLSSADVQKQSDSELTSIITDGKGKMPAYGKSLKPEQINELVAFIRSLAKKG